MVGEAGSSLLFTSCSLSLGDVYADVSCRRSFLGGNLNMQNTVGKLHMQAMFLEKRFWCWYTFISFPVGHKDDMKL